MCTAIPKRSIMRMKLCNVSVKAFYAPCAYFLNILLYCILLYKTKLYICFRKKKNETEENVAINVAIRFEIIITHVLSNV